MHPALASGFGWLFALAFAAVLFGTADASALGLRPLVGSLVIGLTAFGIPMGMLARRHGSAAPSRERLIWTAAAALTLLLLVAQAARSVALASPGDLNINTTETMRAREASFARWGRPPEEVAAMARTAALVALGALAASMLSALAGTAPPRRAGFYLSLPVFGVWTVAALGASLVAGVVALTILGGVGGIMLLPGAGLMAGALFAGLVSAGRRLLLPSA